MINNIFKNATDNIKLNAKCNENEYHSILTMQVCYCCYISTFLEDLANVQLQ